MTALRPLERYINFGFWDVGRAQGARGSLNRRIETKTRELGATKGLYSSSDYDETAFWSIYDRAVYAALKAKVDPCGVFPDLYESISRRATTAS